MAPSVADKHSKIAAEPPLKRKNTTSDSSEDEEDDDDLVVPGTSGSARSKGSGAELVPSSKPGEPMVTKRTLQNRKAQREFRKRREARVRDLEERCRRFDQMGLEANGELQRVAQRFKEENEVLRGLLVRLGFGHLIQSTLDNIPSDAFTQAGSGSGYGPDQSFSAAGVGSSASIRSPSGNVSAPSSTTQEHFTSLPPPPGSVNPNMLDPTGMPAFAPHPSGAITMRWSDDQGVQSGGFPTQQQQQQQHYQQQQSPWAPSDSAGDGSRSGRRSRRATIASGGGRARLDNPDENPLLSLQLGGQNSTSAEDRNLRHEQTDGLTPGTFNHLMGMLGSNDGSQQQGQQQQQQSQQTHQSNAQMPQPPQQQAPSGGGSAFLKGGNNQGQSSMNHGFSMAHRPHQNDALLNPNPIPFALNFSNEPAPDQSWWDRNGGGMFGSDSFLDEKANAVAHAQLSSRNQDGSSSPFDISAFLTSGLTPGSNLNFTAGMPTGFTPALNSANNDPLSAAGADIKGGKEPAAGSAGKPSHGGHSSVSNLSPAEHIQTFLRLVEHRAIRANDDRTRQSGGQKQQQPLRSSGQMITPNAAYSRLAQHPAFMRTDARDLEELVDSLKPTSLATVSAQGSASGAPVEVEGAAVDGLRPMLDRKQRYGSLKGGQGQDGSPAQSQGQQQQQQQQQQQAIKMES